MNPREIRQLANEFDKFARFANRFDIELKFDR